AARFAAGESLVLFAEGTTGDGGTVLPFKSSLFAAIGGSAQRTVQPVTLLWRNRDGSPFDAAQRRRFAWIDDDELLPNARALALGGGARVDIHFEAPVTGDNRKQLAAACHTAIAARVSGDQAATLNRAA
ncbi:MAG: hypothetical protein KGN34_10295, partial [Sphingomonadales bacterium]|nr:hypothetical protein [Sphingomonadales bacterium]